VKADEFVSGLVKELGRNKDQRIAVVIAWYGNVAKVLKSCAGAPGQLSNHVILTACQILAEVRCLEEIPDYHTIEQASPLFGCSLSNNEDTVVSQHRFNVDLEKKTITITAEAFNSYTSVVDENIVFEPLVLSATFSDVPLGIVKTPA
jgi:hypothetical protein